MTWTKISDTFTDDPDMLALPRNDRLLFVEATVFSNRILSDGHIPAMTLRIITDHPEPDKGMAALVDAGLVEVVADGWQIVDFTRHQRSRAQVEHTREMTRRRLDNWRKAKQRNAVTNGGSNALPVPTRPDPKEGEGRGMSTDALGRAGKPSRDKVLADFAAFSTFGQITIAEEDGDNPVENSFALEIQNGEMLIQADVDDWRITNISAWIPVALVAEPPATRDDVARDIPHLETVLSLYNVNRESVYLNFTGQLNHRTQQIADYLCALIEQTEVAP